MAMLVYQRVIPYLPASKQILVMWGCRNVSRPPSPSSSAIPIFCLEIQPPTNYHGHQKTQKVERKRLFQTMVF